jgi:cytochrome c-type biogenesis protein CcmH/NrfG
LPTYQKQLEALGEHVRKNPASLDARFLLAYHDLMLGHAKEAKELLAEIVAKVPRDKQAAELLKQAEKAAKAAGEAKAPR